MDNDEQAISLCEYQNYIDYMIMVKRSLSNRELLKKIALSHDINKMKANLDNVYINSFEFLTLNDSYYEVVGNFAEILRNFEIDNPVVIFGIYSYLFKNGYLSLKHNFAYKKDVRDCYPVFGANVIEGRGVCRHITAMLTDIYKEMGFDSYNVSSVLNRDVSSFSKQKLRKIKDKSSGFSLYGLLSKYLYYPPYNHLVTLVNHPDFGSLIMDPTNDFIFINNKKKDFVSLLDSDEYMDYEVENLFNNNTYFWVEKTNPNLLSGLLFYYSLGWDFADKNSDYFECFYQDNKNIYSKIVGKKRKLSKEFDRYIRK